MPVPTLYIPALGRHVKLGRRRPIARGPRLALRQYLTSALPKPPATVNYAPKAADVLSNIYLNDHLGDCVIAAGYHVVGTLTGNAGQTFTASPIQIVTDYSAIGGYDPTAPWVPDPSSGELVNPTDNGCYDDDALNYWTQTGFQDGTKLVGYVAVDPTSVVEIQTALWLFENLFCGFEMPDTWSNFVQPGFVWDAGGSPNPKLGHCVCGVGYTAQGVTIDTWGVLGTLTYAAIAQYAVATVNGDLYVMLSPDQLAKGQQLAPNGLSWSQLIADFVAIGGTVPPPLSAQFGVRS
jgi:hypothetical protein